MATPLSYYSHSHPFITNLLSRVDFSLQDIESILGSETSPSNSSVSSLSELSQSESPPFLPSRTDPLPEPVVTTIPCNPADFDFFGGILDSHSHDILPTLDSHTNSLFPLSLSGPLEHIGDVSSNNTSGWWQYGPPSSHGLPHISHAAIPVSGYQAAPASYSVPNYSSYQPMNMLNARDDLTLIQPLPPTPAEFPTVIWETNSEASGLPEQQTYQHSHRRTQSTGDIPPFAQQYPTYISKPSLPSRKNNANPFKCRFCGSLFPVITTLRQHVQVQHQDITTRELEQCRKRMVSSKDHLSEVREPKKGSKKDERKGFTCTVCTKSFNRSQDMRRHAVTHIQGFKPYACDICQVTFTRADALNRHVKAQKCFT